MTSATETSRERHVHDAQTRIHVAGHPDMVGRATA